MKDRTEYLNQLVPGQLVTNTTIPQIQPCTGAGWKVVGLFKLSPSQNGGKHHVFVDVVYKNGQVMAPPIDSLIKHGWEGMRPDENPPLVRLDKQPNEPAGNVPIWQGAVVWIRLVSGGADSDTVYNLRTDLPSDGEGNSMGHHSYYVVYQWMDEVTEQPPILPPPTLPPPSPGGGGLHNLYAMHDYSADWAKLIVDAGRDAWCVDTVAVGCDPHDHSGVTFDTHGGAIGHLVRINNGYEPVGTIPLDGDYEYFAQRCGNFVKASRGASRWIIGNEMNYIVERPYGEVITPLMYAKCFSLCRKAIRSVQPDAEVIVGAVAPWNNQTAYTGNENGDWVQYLVDILDLVECDGVAIHTYTHGADPGLITSEAMMDAPFTNRHYNFRAYRDFMAVIIPSRLPVYITETDQDVAWLDQNTGWVQRAYEEINLWNKQGDGQILCLAPYRWPRHDKWFIEGKQGVIADYVAALQHDYKPVVATTSDTGTILAYTNLRTAPGLSSEVITVLPSGTTVQVGEGPVQADGLDWYNVLSPYGIGWVAHYDPYGTQLLQLPREDKRLASPVPPGTPISQHYGEGEGMYDKFGLKAHNGIDFPLPVGTPITAVDDGVVLNRGWDEDGYGMWLKLSHMWGESLYAHLDNIVVLTGQTVSQGEHIANSGNTGNSTGPHLHFGIRLDGYDVDDGMGGYSKPDVG